MVCRPCRDRDTWQADAKHQDSQLIASERAFQEQQYVNALLEEQCAILRAKHQASVAINNQMLERLETAVINQEKLVEQVKDLERGMARLKKSDRAKGKVWQRNLRLKAMVHQYAVRMNLTASPSDTNTTEALQEALATATDRIEELETKGEALLDALEGCDNNGDDQDEDEKAATLLESTIAFRGIIEDETSRELKEHWCELLDD